MPNNFLHKLLLYKTGFYSIKDLEIYVYISNITVTVLFNSYMPYFLEFFQSKNLPNSRILNETSPKLFYKVKLTQS